MCRTTALARTDCRLHVGDPVQVTVIQIGPMRQPECSCRRNEKIRAGDFVNRIGDLQRPARAM